MVLKFCLVICFIFFFFLFPPHSFADESLVLSELLVHPSMGGNEWIEIYNPNQIDLHSYWIDDDTSFSDDSGGSSKKQLITVTDGIYAVFDLSTSMFNNDGDRVVLFDADGTIVDQYEYTTDPGVEKTIGRPNSLEGFEILSSSTKGTINSSPQLPPTATPTKIPTPTRTPTPTRIPTSTKIPTAVPAKSVATKSPILTKLSVPTTRIPTVVVSKFIKDEATSISEKEASTEAIPTAILGVKTSIEPTQTQKKRAEVLVKDISDKNPFVVLPIFIGGLFLIGCGILIYRKRLHQEE